MRRPALPTEREQWTVVLEQFRRGAVRLHVLHHAVEGEIHGAWMTEELAEHGHRVSPGTLYPLLHQLEDAGLLVSREQVVDGRRLRLYEATDLGRDELSACRQALRELAEEVLQPLPGHADHPGLRHPRTPRRA